MSLDVYLEVDESFPVEGSGRIFIRENGQHMEISREEWGKRFPDREPVIYFEKRAETNEVYTANITHNLNTMAAEAEIYQALWRPEEIHVECAKDLICPLEEGLHRLREDPEHFKTFNPENGWGSYEALVSFVENYLNACKKYPWARVRVWR